MIDYYLAVGSGVYLAASAANPNSFKNTTTVNIIKGVAFGLLLWPIGLVILYLENNKQQ